MSHWTHIIASLHIDTNIKDHEIKKVVESMLSKAPKITGSEKDADIFVNTLSGHNTWISFDCGVCTYGKTAEITGEGLVCDCPDDFHCPSGEYQTCVVITIVGNLRDRHKAQTQKEYQRFKKYVVKKLHEIKGELLSSACTIRG